MRKLVLVLIAALPLAACAATGAGPAESSVDAVVQDESQRQKAGQAAQSGETSSEALAHVADGPKSEVAAPR
jgi:uncharacterized protein YcfL